MEPIQNRIGWNAIAFDWNRARTFLLIAEAGSISEAAKQSGQTQPTLSRQLIALEESLNVTLFERVSRGLQLTQSGQELLGYVRNMADAAGKFSLHASAQATTLSGKVVVSANEMDAAYRLPPIIKQIRALAPDIQLDISVSNQIANLQQREADIAIRNVRPTQPELIAKKISEETIGVFGLHRYIDQLEQSHFTQLQVIGFENTDAIIKALSQFGLALTEENLSLTTEFQWLQVQLALQGSGLIILPIDIGLHIGLRQLMPDKGALMTLPIWLVCHRELRTNPRIKFVYDHLAAMLKEPL